jgi:hypothetical protein
MVRFLDPRRSKAEGTPAYTPKAFRSGKLAGYRCSIDMAAASPYTLAASCGETTIGAQPGTDGFGRRDARPTHLRLGPLRVL